MLHPKYSEEITSEKKKKQTFNYISNEKISKLEWILSTIFFVSLIRKIGENSDITLYLKKQRYFV